MMHLNTMRLVVDDIEAKRQPAVAVEAIGPWAGEVATLRYWRSSANFLFGFQADGEDLVLRLAHTSERSRAQILAELDFVIHVGNEGIEAAQPVPSVRGELVEDLEVAGEGFLAVVFERKRGRQGLEPAELSPGMLRAWGRTAGGIHHASHSFVPDPARQRPGWRQQYERAIAMLPEEEGVLRRELGRAFAWLASLPCSQQDQGLVHYDLELDNLIWDRDRFHVVDFDDAMVHWYDYDVAAAVADLLDSPEPVATPGMEQFLAGYHEAAPERRVRLGDLPRFRRCHELMRAARMLFALRGVEPETSPTWLRGLHERLDGWLATQRETFREPFAW